MNTANEPIFKIEVRENEPYPVDLRELWIELQSRRKYGDWAARKLSPFTENEDFASFHNIVKREKGAAVRTDYRVTLDCAKHIALMENTDRGRLVREYFIACEKALRTVHAAGLLAPENFSPLSDLSARIAGFRIENESDVKTYAGLIALHRDLTEQDAAKALAAFDPVEADVRKLVNAITEEVSPGSPVTVTASDLLGEVYGRDLFSWMFPAPETFPFACPGWRTNRAVQSRFGKFCRNHLYGRVHETDRGPYYFGLGPDTRRRTFTLHPYQ